MHWDQLKQMLVQEENVQKDAQMVQNQIFQKIAS
jgi:hypothetical protein